jgi:integrase
MSSTHVLDNQQPVSPTLNQHPRRRGVLLNLQILGNKPAPPKIFAEGWQLLWNLKFRFNCRAGYDERNRYQNHLEQTIGGLPLELITPLILEQLKADFLSRRMKAQTVTHILGLIKHVFNYLIGLGLFCGPNPANAVKMPKDDNWRQRFLSKKEADALLGEVKRRSKQVWQISLLSLSTGMRAGEILKLKGEHINLTTGTIRIVDPKGKKNRTVYLPDLALKMLTECQSQIVAGKLVFPGTHGGCGLSVSKTFSRAVAHLGLNDGVFDPRDKIVFHSLRHTFASWLVQKDQPLYVVGELLGHATLEMTKRYAHLNSERKSAATKIVNLFLN